MNAGIVKVMADGDQRLAALVDASTWSEPVPSRVLAALITYATVGIMAQSGINLEETDEEVMEYVRDRCMQIRDANGGILGATTLSTLLVPFITDKTKEIAERGF